MKTELEKQADALAYEAACEVVPMEKRGVESFSDRHCPHCDETLFCRECNDPVRLNGGPVGDLRDAAIQKREEVRRTLEPFFLKALKGFSSQQVFVVDTDKLKPEDLAALRNDTLGRIGYFPIPAAVDEQ